LWAQMDLNHKSKPVPPGIKVIEGKEEFSYKLNGVNDGREEETGVGAQQNNELRVVV